MMRRSGHSIGFRKHEAGTTNIGDWSCISLNVDWKKVLRDITTKAMFVEGVGPSVGEPAPGRSPLPPRRGAAVRARGASPAGGRTPNPPAKIIPTVLRFVDSKFPGNSLWT